MTVLHVPYGYFPSVCGGTEVYTASLIRCLLEQSDVKCAVAIPSDKTTSYEHEGVRVHTFQISPKTDWKMIYETGDPLAAREFAKLLDQLKPDLVHYHAYSPAVSVHCLRECQKRSVPAIYTFHTPTTTCARGTLMKWGMEICDGEMKPEVCAACQLEGLGMPRTLAQVVSKVSPALKVIHRCLPDKARWQVPVRLKEIAQSRRESVMEWFTGMSSVVALCAWGRELLGRNGLPTEKIKTVRHGLTQKAPPRALAQPDKVRPLRLAFLGRMHPTKGLHVVLEALSLIPDVSLSLDVFSLVESAKDGYAQKTEAQIRADVRVKIMQPLLPNAVIDHLRSYHALVVPSQWLETGPLVVLEAFAAGIPVIGSNLGGIAEWVTHERDGLLVQAGSARAWAESMKRIHDEPKLLEKLRAAIQVPRSMSEVAADMLTIYQQTVSKSS